MSTTTALRSFWNHAGQIERFGYLVGALLFASGLTHVAILIVGGFSWQGPVSLRKAATFGLSFGLTLITIVWVASFVRLSNRTRSALLGSFTVACVLETVLISLQAWRGVPSHFNVETTFDTWVTRLLAAGGVALIAIVVTLTGSAFRANEEIPPSLRLAVRVGFVTLCASLLTGALMIARGMSRVFAGDPISAYESGGAFKPTHAVTMHGVLLLPALAWLLSFSSWSEERRVNVVRLASAGYLVVVGVVAARNLLGG